MKKRNVINMVLAICLGISSLAVLSAGCASDRYNRSTGEYIDDKALAMRVNDALDDNPEYKLDGVEVKTYRGTVQLSGFVNTEDQKERAGRIARKVEGVREVENNVTVKPNPERN